MRSRPHDAVREQGTVETGNVVAADSEEDVKEMMKELLEDEISFAIRYLNLKNLFPRLLLLKCIWNG